jgi:hypothetical protein
LNYKQHNILHFRQSDVRETEWPNGQRVRHVRTRMGLLFVAADICRAIEFPLGAIGVPNVDQVLSDLPVYEQFWGKIDTSSCAGSVDASYAMIGVTSILHLIDIRRQADRARNPGDVEFAVWLGEAGAILEAYSAHNPSIAGSGAP